jgi:hypothetical protein
MLHGFENTYNEDSEAYKAFLVVFHSFLYDIVQSTKIKFIVCSLPLSLDTGLPFVFCLGRNAASWPINWIFKVDNGVLQRVRHSSSQTQG